MKRLLGVMLVWQALGFGGSLIDQVQTTWDKIVYFQADFTQKTTLKGIDTPETTSGKLFLHKPEKLRWEAEEGKSVQILNGNKLWLIEYNTRRKSRSVTVVEDLSKSMDMKTISFLSGKQKFNNIYNIKLLSETASSASFRFSPKKKSQETLIAEIDKNSYLLSAITLEAADSITRIEFRNITCGKKIDPKQFRYVPEANDTVSRGG